MTPEHQRAIGEGVRRAWKRRRDGKILRVVRLDPDLETRLADAAQQNHRTLAGEMEERLYWSFLVK